MNNNRFDYVKYDDKAVSAQNDLKNKIQELETLVETHLPQPSRAKSLIMTKLEEAYMWMGKAIRDDQVIRNGDVELQEERKDS